MTSLRQNFIRELVIRGIASRTQETYVAAVHGLAKHYRQPPDQLTDEQLKDYVFYLARERELSPATLNLTVYALRSFYQLVLQRPVAQLRLCLPPVKQAVHHDFGAVGDSFGTIYSRGKTLQQFLLGYGLSWIPLIALTMYALFISTVIRTPGAAVAVGISTLFLVDFTKHLVGLDSYIFTKYLASSWTNLLQLAQGMDYQWQPEVWKMVALSGAYAVVTFGAGLVIFVRADLNH